jgi:hypothetical protein
LGALLAEVRCHMSFVCHMCLGCAGLVYTGGLDMRFRAWDPRDGGAGQGIAPVMDIDCQLIGGGVYCFPSSWREHDAHMMLTGKSSHPSKCRVSPEELVNLLMYNGVSAAGTLEVCSISASLKLVSQI